VLRFIRNWQVMVYREKTPLVLNQRRFYLACEKAQTGDEKEAF
jgi:hypothetical protein